MKRGIYVFVLVVAFFAAAFVAPRNSILAGLFNWSHRQEVGQFEETLRLLDKYFVRADEVDSKKITGDAIDHILRSLDENSEYMPRIEAEDFDSQTQQKYGGVGIEVDWSDERVTVVSAFEDSPGELVGLLPGDQFVKVEDEVLDGFNYKDVIALLKGEPGSRVAFTIYRPGTDEEIDLEVERKSIKVASVREPHMLEEGIGYIRISQFGVNTGKEFGDALSHLEDEELGGLIIDVRNNPGGVLTAAVSVAGQFFDKGETVVYTKGNDESQDKIYKTKSPKREGDYGIVVLINEGSASASEIVSGALQDVGRARLVGTKSYGKGSVQTIFQFPSGDALRLTTAMFYTPGGRVIHKNGIEPDFLVEQSIEDRRKLILQRRYLKHLGEEAFHEKFEFDPIEDAQLAKAIEVLKGKESGL